MSILSTNTKLIKVGQDYSAGSGISIDDKVISVTGEFGKTYSAGDNISIYEQNEQLYISSKDWTNDIANASANAYNEAVAQIPEPLNLDYISAQVDNKLDTTSFTAWQNGQYTTDLQTIENQISNKLDTTSFSTVSGTFLTDDNTVMLEYGTSTWAEFKSAYDAHKNIVMYKQDTGEMENQYATFGYALFDDTPYEASFTTVCFGTEHRFTLNSNNVWKSYSEMYQYRGNYYSASNPSGFITGVSIPESAVWQDVSTTVQTNSAQWAEGGVLTGDYVSGVNLVKEPYEEGGVRGTFYSANVSGDVTVTTGEYNGTSYIDMRTYSLTSLGTLINDKLDTYLISDSKTLANLDGAYQVFEKAYRNTGTATASAYNVELYGDGSCHISFKTSNNNYLKEATIILESNTEGFVDTNVWDKVSYENNSATLTKYYRLDNLTSDFISFNSSEGWNVTNCDATCTTYSGVEIAKLAFKDEIPTYEYDSTNKISAINGSALAGGGEIVNHDNTLSGNGTVDSPLGVILSATNDANVNNIVVTASLPSTPDANTLYLIPET